MRSIKEPIMWLGARPVYQFCGAEGEGGAGGTGTEGDPKPNEGGTGSGTGGAGDPKPNEGEGTVAKADFEAVQNSLKEFRDNNIKLQKDLKEYQDKDKSELDKATESAKEATARVEKLESDNRGLQIQIAFLSQTKHEWASPAAALKLTDLGEVKIGDDGKVTGLEAALDKTAKDNPFLLKPKGDEKDPKNGASGSSNSGGSGGTGAGGTKHEIPDRDRRFSSLRGRP